MQNTGQTLVELVDLVGVVGNKNADLLVQLEFSFAAFVLVRPFIHC